MTMPTSIFNYVPSLNPKSLTSSVISGALPGIPSGAGQALIGGAIGSLSQYLPSSFAGQGIGNGGGGSADNSVTPLTDFLNDIRSRGVAWNNRFLVSFTPPQVINDMIERVKGPGVDPSRLMLRTDMAELPGISYATSESRNMGPIWKTPVSAVYTDLTLNYIVSADMVERYFFDYWCYAMKDQSDLFEYYENIVTDITLDLYALNNQSVYGVKFYDCWPISVAPIQLSWQDQENMRLTVSFAYSRWDTVARLSPLDYRDPLQAPDPQGSFNFFSDFAFGVLPSIPGASKVLGVLGMGSRDMVRAGVAMVGNNIKTTDPISRTIISAGGSTLTKILGGS